MSEAPGMAAAAAVQAPAGQQQAAEPFKQEKEADAVAATCSSAGGLADTLEEEQKGTLQQQASCVRSSKEPGAAKQDASRTPAVQATGNSQHEQQ